MLSPKDIIASIQMEAAIGNFIPPRPEPLRIAAAAIRIGALTFALPPPARHLDVARMLSSVGHFQPLKSCIRCIGSVGSHVHTEDREQGFVTSRGMFVNRYQALRVAFAAGQTTVQPKGARELTSEDVW